MITNGTVRYQTAKKLEDYSAPRIAEVTLSFDSEGDMRDAAYKAQSLASEMIAGKIEPPINPTPQPLESKEVVDDEERDEDSAEGQEEYNEDGTPQRKKGFRKARGRPRLTEEEKARNERNRLKAFGEVVDEQPAPPVKKVPVVTEDVWLADVEEREEALDKFLGVEKKIPIISDEAFQNAIKETVARTNNRKAVADAIQSFATGDRKLFVADFPQEHRAELLLKLAKISSIGG